MSLIRVLLVSTLMLAGSSGARAGERPKPLTAAEAEARNETAAPSFSGQVGEARRVASFLADALLLNNAQQHAVTAYTVAEREALALAITPADAADAQRDYLLAVRRVLATSQWQTYGALRQQFADTLLPLDGPEVAQR